MKNKKLLALVCASVMMLSAFTACSSKEDSTTEEAIQVETSTNESTEVKLQDGTYRAELKDFDERGWKSFLEVTVAEGKMTEVKFDDMTAEGALKTEDAEYNTKMKDIAGTSPAEFAPALGANLVETQDPSAVDVVTGATSSSETFKTLGTALMENMAAGNTEVVIVQ